MDYFDQSKFMFDTGMVSELGNQKPANTSCEEGVREIRQRKILCKQGEVYRARRGTDQSV